MTNDKTGAPTQVTAEADRFTIAVDGQIAGFTEYVDRVTDSGTQRIFPHTEVDEAFGGRGLATILVREALEATRADGLRIVPVCSLVASFVEENHEFDDIVDPVTTDVKRVLSKR